MTNAHWPNNLQELSVNMAECFRKVLIQPALINLLRAGVFN
jgi:hypothetical protein